MKDRLKGSTVYLNKSHQVRKPKKVVYMNFLLSRPRPNIWNNFDLYFIAGVLISTKFNSVATKGICFPGPLFSRRVSQRRTLSVHFVVDGFGYERYNSS